MISTDKCQMCIHQSTCLDYIHNQQTARYTDVKFAECRKFSPHCKYCKHFKVYELSKISRFDDESYCMRAFHSNETDHALQMNEYDYCSKGKLKDE